MIEKLNKEELAIIFEVKPEDIMETRISEASFPYQDGIEIVMKTINESGFESIDVYFVSDFECTNTMSYNYDIEIRAFLSAKYGLEYDKQLEEFLEKYPERDIAISQKSNGKVIKYFEEKIAELQKTEKIAELQKTEKIGAKR